MVGKRKLLLFVVLMALFPPIFLRCERNDLFEISNLNYNCRLPNALMVEYLITGVANKVTCDGVSFGDVPIAGSTMTFQLINNMPYALVIREISIDQSDYTNMPYTASYTNTQIEAGLSYTFYIALQSSIAGGYNAVVNIKFSTTDGSMEDTIIFTVEGRTVL